ncbi:MAG: hypothetical protein IJ796_07320 [Lachnospiraceae bacterium]|nr:hypothetical protein [Lachnospiraceae bacterium]
MIKDIKLGFGLIRFAPKYKTNIAFCIIFPVIGLIYEIMNIFGNPGFTLGGYFVALAPIYLVQILYSIGLSGMVQSSSAKRKLMTSSVSMVYSSVMILGFLLIAGIKAFAGYYHNWENVRTVSTGLLLSSLIMVFSTFYVQVVYRWIVAGYLILIPMVMLLVFGGVGSQDRVTGLIKIAQMIPFTGNYVLTFLISLVIVIANAFLFYGLSVAFYRKPLASRLFKRMLERA